MQFSASGVSEVEWLGDHMSVPNGFGDREWESWVPVFSSRRSGAGNEKSRAIPASVAAVMKGMVRMVVRV